MRAATAYFVGAGTIIAAIAIGLGGGIVAGNIMNPVTPKKAAAAKVEPRAEAAATTTAPSEPVQFLTGSQAFGAVVAAPADARSAPANSEASAAQPSQAVAADSAKPADTAATPEAKPAERQATSEPAAAVDNAYAKAKDSDVKQAAAERRRAERRQLWAERRRSRDTRDPRELRGRTDWDDVARNVHEDADSRASPSRREWGFPQMRLFGGDDDD